MNVEKCIKASFAVIGKEGSTEDGAGFVQLHLARILPPL